MGGQKRNMPSHKRIVAANAALIATLPNLGDENPEFTCWACGAPCGEHPERAHVHAKRNGGTEDPSNMFLLCSYCHEGQPDGAPRDAQIRWLLSQPHEDERRAKQHQALREVMQRYAVPSSAPWFENVVERVRQSLDRGSFRARGVFDVVLFEFEEAIREHMGAPHGQ